MSTETKRRAVVQRAVPNAPKTTNNNTINLQSDITLYFVWYPGARDLAASLITLAPKQSIPYVWQRKGMSPVKGNLTTGELTLNLPPRSKGSSPYSSRNGTSDRFPAIWVLHTTWEQYSDD